MKWITPIVFLLGIFFTAHAQQASPQRSMDIIHYCLDIEVDIEKSSVAGVAKQTFQPLWDGVQKVSFHATNMKINHVKLGEQSLTYQHSKNKLSVDLGKPYRRGDTLTIDIHYQATPKQGIYFIRPTIHYPGKPYQVWTQGEAEDNRHWFPSYDFPNDFATSEVIVTVDNRLQAISNGVLIRTKKTQNKKIQYHWQMNQPHVSYLTTLVIGQFEEIKETVGKIPLYHYVQKKDLSKAMGLYKNTAEMIPFFAKKAGLPYPYEKYSQIVVEDFFFSGMENASASTLAQRKLRDDRALLFSNSEDLIVHELAHQWWGNIVTCRNWYHIWLNEGFATYSEAVWREEKYGLDSMKWKMEGLRAWYLSSDKHKVVWRGYESTEDIFNSHAYGKGAWVLHMLRTYLGDKVFWRGIQLYTQQNQFSPVSSQDLQHAMEEASGKDLEWFFQQWLHRVGHPKFHVKFHWDSENKMAIFHVKQTQKDKPYRIPLDLGIVTKEQSYKYRVVLDGREQKIYLPVAEKPLFPQFDIHNNVLKELDFPLTTSQAIQKWQKDSDSLGRVFAGKQLVKKLSPAALQSLSNYVPHGPKSEVTPLYVGLVKAHAQILGQIPSEKATRTLIKMLHDSRAVVREAAAKALADHPGILDSIVIKNLKELFRVDDSYEVRATALLSLSDYVGFGLDEKEMEKHLAQALKYDSYQEVVRCAALKVYQNQEDEKYLNIVQHWMKPGQPQNCRMKAMEAYVAIVEDELQAAKTILPFLKDDFFRVREKAIELLEEINHPIARAPLARVAKLDPLLFVRLAAMRTLHKIDR